MAIIGGLIGNNSSTIDKTHWKRDTKKGVYPNPCIKVIVLCKLTSITYLLDMQKNPQHIMYQCYGNKQKSDPLKDVYLLLNQTIPPSFSVRAMYVEALCMLPTLYVTLQRREAMCASSLFSSRITWKGGEMTWEWDSLSRGRREKTRYYPVLWGAFYCRLESWLFNLNVDLEILSFYCIAITEGYYRDTTEYSIVQRS